MIRTKLIAFTVTAMAVAANSAQGTQYLSADYSTYASGNLVGQNGWNQLGAANTLPLQVAGGQVAMPFGQSADNQDAWKDMSAVISAPGVGTTTMYYGLKMSVQQSPTVNLVGTPPPPPTSSYFAAVYTGSGASGFANERMFTAASGSGFVIAAKVTGQSGSPFGSGSTVLNYNQVYNVVLAADMVAGAGNDVIRVYVDPTNANPLLETPYFTVGVGTGTDPTGWGSFVLSQFGNASVLNSGVTINSVVVSDSFAEAAMVPEPSSWLLAVLGFVGLAHFGRKRFAR